MWTYNQVATGKARCRLAVVPRPTVISLGSRPEFQEAWKEIAGLGIIVVPGTGSCLFRGCPFLLRFMSIKFHFSQAESGAPVGEPVLVLVVGVTSMCHIDHRSFWNS